MKVVIDTNTLINASVDDYNYGNRIIDHVLTGKIQAFANSQTLRENQLLTQQKITDSVYLNKLNQYFEILTPVEPIRINVVEDRDDNKILASAVAAKADYLITSDWHLLKLNEYENVKIVSPEAFWGEYEQDSGQGWQKWLNDFMQ